VQITSREEVSGCYVVTARASFPDGRHDESIGAVPIENLKGEARANAVMKCETKAKRRVTLSLVGLSTLDESEVDSIPGAQPVTSPDIPQVLGSMPPLDPPAPARDSSRDRALEQPAGEAATPADLLTAPLPTGAANLNAPVPEAWKPFVATEAYTARIVGGKVSKATGKTTITLPAGIECWTMDREVGQAAIRYKERQTPVTITRMDSGEIVTLAEATDAAF
jgi:hypothetical protein